MSTRRKNQIHVLERLRLPDLQKRFAELTGETTRSPNKKYLIRRICEALKAAEARATAAPKRPAKPKVPKASKAVRAQKASRAPKTSKKATRKRPTEKKTAKKTESSKPATVKSSTDQATDDRSLSKLSVADLQARYKETVGRPTGSSHRGYLLWKIRQAQKGRIPVGPTRLRSSVNPGDYKVIPLRMETEVVDQIDAARERLDLPSRTTLIRRALMLYLAKAGENDVAALLEQGE